MTPESLLLAIPSTYAALHSYQDRGVVLTHFPSKSHPDEATFTTVFRRPDYFRFE